MTSAFPGMPWRGHSVRESKENERVFWSSIYTKLLPLQVAGDQDKPLDVTHRIERVIVDPQNSDR